jgi:ATP-dependent RNA helicase DOB1
MSGRAGRRGKDDRGIVIQMIDEKMEPDIAKGMLYGDPDPLYSSYHVSYNMVLNMMRVEDADPEHILRASFYQYQREQKAPELDRQASELHHSAMALTIPHEEEVAEYSLLLKQVERTQSELETLLFQHKYCLPFLQPGRLVTLTVKSGFIGSLTLTPSSSSSSSLPSMKPLSWGQGIIVNCRKVSGEGKAGSGGKGTLSAEIETVLGKEAEGDSVEYVMDVLVEVVKVTDPELLSLPTSSSITSITGLSGSYLPLSLYESLSPSSPTSAPSSEFLILQYTTSCLSSITAIRLTLPSDLRKQQNLLKVTRALQEVKRRFATEPLPLLDPKSDMKVKEEGYGVLCERLTELQERMRLSAFNQLQLPLSQGQGDGGQSSSANASSGKRQKKKPTGGAGESAGEGAATGGEVSQVTKESLLSLYDTKQALLFQAKHFQQLSSETKTILMRGELRSMKRLLKKLHFVGRDSDVLEVKGRFSCEVNTSDEVLLTDMVFEGVFNTLSVETTVSLLSCFVYNEPLKTSKGGGAASLPSSGGGGSGHSTPSTSALLSSSSFSKLRPEFQALVKGLHTSASKLYSHRSEYKLLNTVSEESYLSSFNYSLMEVLALWCSGGKFIEICRLTDVYEGTIIRVIRRLEELLRQLITACTMIGNMELRDKFEQGAERIRRGIIFTSSLYL